MTKPPPVPPANRSSKGTGSDPASKKPPVKRDASANPKEQGDTGNIRQNTTHQGYQQDR